MKSLFFKKLFFLIKIKQTKKELKNKKDFIAFAEDEFKNLSKKNLRIPVTLFNL